jgi:citrate synthase
MAITVTHKIENDETSPAMFGEYEHLDYSSQVTFPELVFQSFTGKIPTAEQTTLFNVILNLCFDHGPHSPSGAATVAAATEGEDMGDAVAAGIAKINDSHGGAGEPLMEILYKVKREGGSVKDVVDEYVKEGKRMPGFGHRVYKDVDPRAQLLLNIARQQNVGVEFVDMLEELHQELNAQLGKNLPVNIDGAIAATMCGLGLEPKLGKAVFIVARTPGLIAHFLNNS